MLTTPRNDGTDLWKSTLSGQPPVAKPQQNANAWSHTPQNPTDYKNWGEDDDNGGGGGGGHNGPIGSQATGGQNAGPNAHMGGGTAFGAGAPGSAPGRNDTTFWGSDAPNGPQYNGKQSGKKRQGFTTGGR